MRVSIEGIPLIDKKLESMYHASLFKLLEEWDTNDQLISKPMINKLSINKEEKKKKSGTPSTKVNLKLK